jgi:hypothetical protein
LPQKEELALLMHATFAVAVAFWFALGVMIGNWPMMLANAVTFFLTVVIVSMKLHYGYSGFAREAQQALETSSQGSLPTSHGRQH